MAIKRRTGPQKSPPILSHEYFIQNHADIISCVAMVIVVSLLFQATSPYAANFVALQHNTTEAFGNPYVQYSSGPKDLCVIFFYLLISIVIHAVVQDYLIDKVTRKLNLSKTKNSRFNESGQFLFFNLISILWAGEILRRENFLMPVSRLWTDYPEKHIEMPYMTKYYFIVQIAYWLHAFPELYFQKVKRDEMASRITYALLNLFFFVSAYFFNFTRIALCLSLMHYFSESLSHLSRLLYYAKKTKISSYIFNMWNVVFVLVRFLSISLSVLTFWYGLAATSIHSIDYSSGNFNTPFIRFVSLNSLAILQAWMMWNFITFHLVRLRERANEIARRKKNALERQAAKQRQENSDMDDLPEVDQQQQFSSATNAAASKASPKATGKVKTK